MSAGHSLLEAALARLAHRAGQTGHITLASVSGRADRWHAEFNPGARLSKTIAQGKTPLDALLLVEGQLDAKGRRRT